MQASKWWIILKVKLSWRRFHGTQNPMTSLDTLGVWLSVLKENGKIAWPSEIPSSTEFSLMPVLFHLQSTLKESLSAGWMVISNVTSLLAVSILVICSFLWVILHSCKVFRMQRNEFWLRTDMLSKIVAFIGNKAEKEHKNGNQRKILKDKRLGRN